MKTLTADAARVHVELVAARLRKHGFNVSVAFGARQGGMTALGMIPCAIQ